jgi:hypothetical protein
MTIYENPRYKDLLKLSMDGSDGNLLGLSAAIIRTSQKLNIFYSKVFRKTIAKLNEGGVEFESIPAGLPVNLHIKRLEGGFEFDSFRLRTAVNKAKMRPPKALCTIKAVGAERSLRSISLRLRARWPPAAIASPSTLRVAHFGDITGGRRCRCFPCKGDLPARRSGLSLILSTLIIK